MAETLTLKEVLNRAIGKEIEAQALYADLTEKVNNQAAKDAFRELVRQEKGHQNLLEKYNRGELGSGALSHGKTLDYKIIEQLDQVEISTDMELKDVFLLAAAREKAAHEFYLGLAAIHPAGEVKKLITELASQELGHKHRVEYLFTEVGFPQLDGG